MPDYYTISPRRAALFAAAALLLAAAILIANSARAAEAADPPSAATASDSDRIANLEGKVEGLTEDSAATKAATDAMAKLKFSGYVQGRYEWHQDSKDGLDATGKPADTTGFLVRRGRLKAVYSGSMSEFVLQIDATGKGVVLRDAEASLVEAWTPLGLKLTLGQFKVPFGYEIVQSSGDREMPERSRVFRALFPGERDRGLRLTGKWEALRLAFAVVNGNGIEDAIYTANDQNSYKDLVGRNGADLKFDALSVVFGVSAYKGRGLKTTLATAAKVSGKDANADGKIVGDEITFTPGTAASWERYDRMRMGADVQLYIDVPYLGGLALKGEAVSSTDTYLATGDTAADATKDVSGMGYTALAVQNLGAKLQAVLRMDHWDPNTAKDNDAVTTLGGGLVVRPSGTVKVALIYEHPKQEVAAGLAVPTIDIFTAQVQGSF